jgi:DNA-binding transcriptional LysR family regulator
MKRQPTIEVAEMTFFATTVRLGSFARAAAEHGVAPSVVSRAISRVEQKLGVRLLQRTTRRLGLTEAGHRYHARVVQVLSDLEETAAEASAGSLTARGLLRLGLPVVFGRLHVTQLIGPLLAAHPDLSVELLLTDRFVDLVEENIDLAIRIGALADTRLVARRLCANRRILVASPDYLARRGNPGTPAALAAHDAILFAAMARPREWALTGPAGPVRVTLASRFVTDNGEVATEAAVAGLGIAMGATFSVAPHLATGRLVRVLPDHAFAPSAIHAVFPSSRQLSRKVRVMVDALVLAFPDPPPWDRSLAGRVPGFG